MKNPAGWLEVIVGPMYSGKTEELIRRIRRAKIARRRVQVFNHVIDTRYGTGKKIYSHSKYTVGANRVSQASEIARLVKKRTQIVVIDEAQWFGEKLIDVVQQLVSAGKTVLVAGLALTYEGKPFPPMPSLMAMSDEITKLKAVCAVCGHDAGFHVRLAKKTTDNPLLADRTLVGHAEYEPRCRLHFR